MKHFTGRLNFFRSAGTGTIVALAADEDFSLAGYVKLGTSDVIHVDFADTREAEIEAIEAEMKQKSEEHQQWLDVMAGKVQSLKAIEHSEVA